MRTDFLCISVLRVASGPRVKLVSCKSALNPTVVYSNDRSKAVVYGLFYEAICFMSYLMSFCFCVFQSFYDYLACEERAHLSVFRTFVRFVLVWNCWFPLPLGVCEGLRFVIATHPGLFSYPFFFP